MRCHQIQLLSKTLPEPVVPRFAGPDGCFDEAGDIGGFISAYTEPAYGWRSAQRLAAAGSPWPIYPSGSMVWSWRAWQFMRKFGWDTEKWPIQPGQKEPKHGFRLPRHMSPLDLAVIQAVGIETAPRLTHMKETLQSLLVTQQQDCRWIARRTGVPKDHVPAVEAYEALFFNTLDRKEDHFYLRNIIYPESRLVELAENYFHDKAYSKILKRMAYNSTDIEAVLWFSGFRSNYMESIDRRTAVALFQDQVMVQALVLARNGFLSFPTEAPALAAAKSIITASKIGGEVTQDPEEPSSTMGDVLRQEVAKAVKLLAV